MAFRWAIIGPGGIARKFAAAVQAMDEAEVYAVVSRSADRARSFCEAYEAKQAYDDVQQMVRDEHVDGVYIGTPHRFHHEQALACLRAGKAVLCEKPMTVNAEQTEALIETVRAQGVFLMEAMWTRFLPIYAQVRQWLDEDAIGPVRLVSSSFGIPAYYRMDPTHRLLDPALAGGAILDMGIYPLAVTQDIYGSDPKAVQALGQVAEGGADLFSGATLDYGSNRVAQFMCTLLSTAPNRLFVHGDKGRIELPASFFGTTRATLYTEDEERTVTRPFGINGFEYQIQEVQACVAAGRIESERMPLAQSLGSARVMDEIRRQIGARYAFE